MTNLGISLHEIKVLSQEVYIEENEWFRNEYVKFSCVFILPYSMSVSIYQRILKFANISREQTDISVVISVLWQ